MVPRIGLLPLFSTQTPLDPPRTLDNSQTESPPFRPSGDFPHDAQEVTFQSLIRFGSVRAFSSKVGRRTEVGFETIVVDLKGRIVRDLDPV